MSDIVERLRAWVYTDSLYATAREAADEIERLRQVSSQENMTDAERDVCGASNSTPDHSNVCGEYRTGSDGETAAEDAAKCTVKSEKLPERDRLVRSLESRLDELRSASDKADAEYREEIARLRLTDAEREAVEQAADLIDAKTCGDPATLRALLARLSPPAT